jgi:hypothetical protein
MPGAGPHRFEFIGKEPLVFRVLVVLFVAAGFFGLALDFGAKYFLPKASESLQACKALSFGSLQYHAPRIVCWYADQWISIEFILFAAIALTMIILRKRVRYVYRGGRQQ